VNTPPRKLISITPVSTCFQKIIETVGELLAQGNNANLGIITDTANGAKTSRVHRER
jgi:hypothetical protein